jgi:hypothetical protein
MKKTFLIAIVMVVLLIKTNAQVGNTNTGTNAGNAGSYNTSTGVSAGDVVTGLNNSFHGYYSGKNTTGTGNSFFGYQSGLSNTVGGSNTFIGSGAGTQNTSGGSNVFVGVSAGAGNATGFANVSIGVLSGFNLKGSSNVLIGNSAGVSLTSGSGNIFVGSNAGWSETGSNKLYIDNSNTTTPLIYGDFSTDKLSINGAFNVTGNTGLGITTPTERLEVAGTARLNAVTQDNALNRVLVSDNTGKIFWRDALNLTGSGDNLGNHIATQSIIAGTANSYDLGSSTNYFKNLYINDKIFSQSIQILKTTAGDGSANTSSIFLGESSGFSNSGVNNSALGAGTLFSNTTGVSNTSIGRTSLYYNTSGSNNTALGTGALYANTTGYGNMAVGASLTQNTTGYVNVAVGLGALQYNVTGFGNVGIGNGAGMISGQTNLSNTIAIGSNAQVNANEAIAIGANSVVNVSQGLVLGTAGSLVGIRNNSPAYALHVFNAYCNGNTWVNASDKNIKENFRTITSESILDKVMKLKIERWCYKADDLKIDHIGPYAQDFYKQFKLGDNDKSIATVDESGIALAAIQELNGKVQKLEDLINIQQQLITSLLNGKVENTENKTGLKIYQNNPNPFSIDAEIQMDIPEEVVNATLYIYDLQGKTILESVVVGRGSVIAKIEGGRFTSGIYLYTLIADGQSTDVKRMLLTK